MEKKTYTGRLVFHTWGGNESDPETLKELNWLHIDGMLHGGCCCKVTVEMPEDWFNELMAADKKDVWGSFLFDPDDKPE